jgi:hypothetical protein
VSCALTFISANNCQVVTSVHLYLSPKFYPTLGAVVKSVLPFQSQST